MTRMGIECEVPHLAKSAAEVVDWCDVDIHNDGSIRNNNYIIDGVPVLPMRTHNNQFVYPSGAKITDNYGAEIVTKPYEYSELYDHAKGIARMFGHVPTTPRASLHVHVDTIDQNWRYVQNLLHWFICLEAPLFRLSALGEQHRGNQWFTDPEHPDRGRYQQDHNYARPLTNSIGIRRGTRMVPLIDTDQLIAARSASEMVAAWGRLDLSWGTLTRYCPHRLHALNIVPLMTYHTVEWRLFNGRYRYLPKVLEVVHAVHALAEKPVPKAFPCMPLGSTPSFSADDMSALIDVDVREIWGRHWVAPCTERAIKAHYRDEEFFAPQLQRTALHPIYNNVGDVDRGADTFCFGSSLGPRGIRPIQRAPIFRVLDIVPDLNAQLVDEETMEDDDVQD